MSEDHLIAVVIGLVLVIMVLSAVGAITIVDALARWRDRRLFERCRRNAEAELEEIARRTQQAILDAAARTQVSAHVKRVRHRVRQKRPYINGQVLSSSVHPADPQPARRRR